MPQCEAFIGSYSSNVAILVHDLLLARKNALGEASVSLDVNGRAYCGCGASFCMQLERKLERGYPMGERPGVNPSPTKQLIDQFRY